MTKANYLPYIQDEDLTIWNVLSLDFCIGWGGRQCEIECQAEIDGKYLVKAFAIYGLTGKFEQWDAGEVKDCTPIKSTLYESVMKIFKDFEELKNDNSI